MRKMLATIVSVILLIPTLLVAEEEADEPCEFSCYTTYSYGEPPPYYSACDFEYEAKRSYWHVDCPPSVYALPGGGPLMPPFLADPRKVGMSAGWRFGDAVIEPDRSLGSGPVSFGDYAGLVRWCNPFCSCGVLDLGIEGNIWAIFQQQRYSAPLVNADYYIAIPLTYARGSWAYRARIFHISSHIGDEFLLNNPGFDRRNPSSEYIDFFVTWRPNCDMRVYGGIGLIARSDESFKFKAFYAEYGIEYYFPFLRWYMPRSCCLGKPFFGANFRSREDNRYYFDGTFVLGYEWARTYCDFKKVRIYFEYHDGFSLEGQFSRKRTQYGALVAYYGY